jgi:hypothetical protein
MNVNRHLVVSVAALALISASCARSEPTTGSTDSRAAPRPALLVADGHYPSVLIEGVPHVLQKPDFCGEAATEMALKNLGKTHTQDDVFALSGMDPARGMGATTRELKTALRRVGFEVGPVWHQVEAASASKGSSAGEGLEKLFGEMHADLQHGVPSIVCMHYDDAPGTTEHFRLILGYDADSGEVVYHEPAVAQGAYQRMKRSEFMSLWPLKYASDSWTVIRFRLAPGSLRDPVATVGHTPADYAQHVRQLSKELPSNFSLVVEPPFVVLGDGGKERVQRSAVGTVRWAVRMLEKDFFDKQPKEILNVWLFADKTSYQHHNMRLFGEAPGTPYGFYTREHGALVMNIATGGGTLVHEIVHPYIEANFPASPAWFNEGLGSLYEQSAERDGQIVGLTNWRLAGLQRAIRRGPIQTFQRLTATSSHEFYSEDPGTNYAQSRYLLYYLQEKKLLRSYYRAFVQGQQRDPTGFRTLKRVLGESDMRDFQRRWERFVLGLRFR